MSQFQPEFVDFKFTNSFSSLILDYISKSSGLNDFQSFQFNVDGIKEAIDYRTKYDIDRELLSKILRNQYEKVSGNIFMSNAIKKNIDLLSLENTFTITTGHQLNIFTGPLYFIYKIISAIRLSGELKVEFPKYNFVPLYWMASEDHDLEEISFIYLLGKKIEWKPLEKGAAGKIKCNGIPEIIHSLKSLLKDKYAERVLDLFERAYAGEHTLSEATRIVVHELFSEYGLIILDADEPEMKQNFIHEMKDDVINHSAFHLVNETISEIEKDYKVQVHPREINFFYLGENFRERIIETDGMFSVLNQDIKFSKDELLSEIEKHPEKFSPNVVLRPLYQEKILPDIAYVGGPAEIAYWMEYKKMFEHYGAKLPVLVLRSCALVIDSLSNDRLKKLGFKTVDIFLSEDDLINKYLKSKTEEAFSMESTAKKIESLFNEVSVSVSLIDSTFKASVEAEKQKMLNSLRSLEERLKRAEKKKHETAINQIRKLKEKFFPGKELQERSENLLAFYSLFGNNFLEELFKHLNPLDKKFTILVEESL
jgi:bacillithiol biosynthesis cysteine-adding enzyme BshC